MSTKVIKDISCNYASISGNVSYVNKDYVSVPDLSDIDWINKKISKLESIIYTLQEENKEMHELLKKCILELSSMNQANIAKIVELIEKHQAATLAFIENSQKQPNM